MFFVAPSSVSGLGVFAREHIASGTVWWRGETQRNVLPLNRDAYRTLQASEHSRSECSAALWHGIVTYTLYNKVLDAMMWVLDDTRFINHSAGSGANSRCSTLPSGELESVAVRDIAPGQEILEDYSLYDVCPWPEFELEDENEAYYRDQHHLEQLAVLRQQYAAEHHGRVVPTSALDRLAPFVAEADGRGMGLFVGVDAAKGALVWQQTHFNVLAISRRAWLTLAASDMSETCSRGLRDAILVYSFFDAALDSLMLCLDNARFCNHDRDHPTIGTARLEETGEAVSVLLHDCSKGQELVDNYHEYDECPFVELAWERFVNYPRQHAVVVVDNNNHLPQ